MNAGNGGHGGPWTAAPSATYTPLPCANPSFYISMGVTGSEIISYCTDGQHGKVPLYPQSAGQGGLAWEKKTFLDLILDIGQFTADSVTCVAGSVGSCASAAVNLYDLYGTYVGIAQNDANYIRSAGEGGGTIGPNAQLDVAYFNPPVAGGGGGGSGKTIISFSDDKAGGEAAPVAVAQPT